MRRQDERGVALIYAVALAMLAMTTVVTLAGYAASEGGQSGTFRRSSAAIAAAEGQVDVTIARIASHAATGVLPCSPSSFTESSTGTDVVTVTTTVAYADSSGTALTCPLPAGAQVSSAVVRAVATAPGLPGGRPVRRVLEGTLAITGGGTGGSAGGSFPRAVFADHGVTFANGVRLSQQATSGSVVPSVYTNGDFQCNNSMQVDGPLIVRGRTTLAGACLVAGDVRSRRDVAVHNLSARIDGDVLVSAGSAAVVDGVTIGGSIRASGMIMWQGCPSRCAPNTAVAAAASETLPPLPWNATVRSAWEAAGWAVVTFDDPSHCALTGSANAPGQWLLTYGAAAGTKTLLHTICRVVLQPNNATISMSRDLAVVADGGIQISNSLRFTSSGGARALYLVQPSGIVPAPCTPGISLDNQVSIDATVSTLLYSPCDIRVANAFTFGGQLYSGSTVRLENAVGLEYRPLPVPGQPSAGGAPSAYTLQVTGKRENT